MNSFFCLFFFETEFLCVALAFLSLTVDQAGLELTAFLCIPRAEVKQMRHCYFIFLLILLRFVYG